MKDGKVESFKEAFAIVMAHYNCSGQSCGNCPMNRDRDGEAGNGECENNKRRVNAYLSEHLGIKNFRDAKDPALEAYNFVMGLDSLDKKPKEELKAGTCETCLHSAMHPSGILFCKNFHNFVHENGFCYRYVDGKMDEETTCG